MLLIGKEKGFTLLEVLIVIIFIVILIGVSLPNFDQFLDSIEIRGQLRKVEHYCRGARERSITQNIVVEIKVNDDGLLLKQGDGNIIDYELEIKNRNIDEITYYPDGSSSGGIFSIAILDKYLYTVNIDPITGKLEWSRSGVE